MWRGTVSAQNQKRGGGEAAIAVECGGAVCIELLCSAATKARCWLDGRTEPVRLRLEPHFGLELELEQTLQLSTWRGQSPLSLPPNRQWTRLAPEPVCAVWRGTDGSTWQVLGEVGEDLLLQHYHVERDQPYSRVIIHKIHFLAVIKLFPFRQK